MDLVNLDLFDSDVQLKLVQKALICGLWAGSFVK